MDTSQASPQGAVPRLWNPNAAAAWSLVFSPIFGAVLHMKNWRALGETAKAEEARQWAVGLSVALGLLILVSMVLPYSRGLDMVTRLANLILLLAWYYGTGKAQVAYVLARHGRRYPRKGWGEPILIGIALVAGLAMVAAALGFMAGLLAVPH